MSQVLAEAHDGKIRLLFDYDASTVTAVKQVAGAKFVPATKGGPFWTVPLTLGTGRALRRHLGKSLQLGPALIAWGKEQVAHELAMEGLASAEVATLQRLPTKLPELNAALASRPWQPPAVAFMAKSTAPLNADEPRMGKTLVTIAAVFEADLEHGPQLVIAPKTALETVWKYEIERWTGTPVFVCDDNRSGRDATIAEFVACTAEIKWLVINPAMVRWTDKGAVYPELFKIEFNTVTLDESQTAGIVNTKSATSVGVRKLKRIKTQVTTGSPMKGKAINLWSILNFLNPKEFSSKWKFAYAWLYVTNNGFGNVIGALRPEVEDDFYKTLTPYMLRRKRTEVRKDLPNDPPSELWVDLSSAAQKQYATFAEDAYIRIEEEQLSATSILAEYTRLKQFAWGKHKLIDGKLIPTLDSGKWEALMQLLEERDIFNGNLDDQVVVFSQSKQIVDLIVYELQKRGVLVGKITGDVTRKGERTQLQQAFQDGKLQVMVMTTTAGGVAITLNRARTAIIVDETWVPDDQQQAVDRIENMARTHALGVYYLRTRNTIDADIMVGNLDKAAVNAKIMDTRRKKKS